MTRAAVHVTLLLSLLLSAAPRGWESPAEVWTSVRTKNFVLVGSAGARELRELASRLEQFREICARLLDERHFDESVPATVVVFGSDEAYRPFKPLYKGRPSEVAGHFQAGPDGDYLVLSVEKKRHGGPRSVALHEYVHLLVKNSFRDAPLWFNEGLAEYYSTLRTSDGGRRVALGRALPAHLLTLRRNDLLPLRTLFAVGRDSEHYNERGARGVFYAQSWALVHFLLTADGGARRPQLSRYLELLAAGAADPEAAFREAFRSDYAALENELRTYVRLARYEEREVRFEQELGGEAEAGVAPLSAAEARAQMGDLLLHAGRLEEAEEHFRRALALDPGLARAHASLGVLRLRQDKIAEAKEHLARAVAADPRSHLARYQHAYALSREGADVHRWVTDYDPAAAELMRAELRRAVELAPHFVDAYRLHAFVNLVRDERSDESIALLKRALSIAPRRHELSLLLAQVHLRREEFEEARRVLAPLASGDPSRVPAQARVQAGALLDSFPRREEMAARRREASAAAPAESVSLAPLQPCDMAFGGPQHKRMRFEGEQRCGLLVSVECDDAGGVLLLVSTADGRTLRLRAAALSRVRFVTYTAEVRTGPITCGPREPAPNPVLVTFRADKPDAATADGTTASDGEAIAVEFVPREWHAGK